MSNNQLCPPGISCCHCSTSKHHGVMVRAKPAFFFTLSIHITSKKMLLKKILAKSNVYGKTTFAKPASFVKKMSFECIADVKELFIY